MEKNDIILSVENVSKQYRLGEIGTGTLSHDLKRWWYKARGKEDPFLKIGETNNRSQKGESDYVWALKDISFEVGRGEVLGIIGKNGAGKSTLLKILSKVTGPTTGTIKSKGRIASLLEVGTGFHPELTGRENIYLNGAILGMTKKEITEKIDDIIEFSGCQRYIDTPTKRYSSGMTVRLAFAVAAFLEPEILIVDEVLAVGDAEFQKKALGKMQDISRGQGRTVLFVSHDMSAVEALCQHVVIIEHGQALPKMDTHAGIAHYLATASSFNLLNAKRKTEGGLGIQEISVNGKKNALAIVKAGDQINIEYTLNNALMAEEMRSIALYTVFRNERNVILFTLSNRYFQDVSSGNGTFSKLNCTLPEILLGEGIYRGTTWLSFKNGFCEEIEDAFAFEVVGGDYFNTGQMPVPRKHGAYLIKQIWNYET